MWPRTGIQHFKYLINLLFDGKTVIFIDFYGIYKLSVQINLTVNWDMLDLLLRWVRPQALLNRAERVFDFNIKPYTGYYKVFDIAFIFNDGLNINFNKDLTNSTIDVLDLGWNSIVYPDDVSEDDTKKAFEMTDFVP